MSEPRVEISDPDAVMVIGVLAVLSGSLLAEALDEEFAKRLRDWLAREGMVSPDATQRALSFALQDVIERLRHARGEYEDS